MRTLAILLFLGGMAMAGGTVQTIKLQDMPGDFIFNTPAIGTGTSQILFTIKHDGTIMRGPAFTTNDEASLEFWKAIERSYPKFREQILHDSLN